MRITKLEYQKKDPNRVNVYVDDKFIAGVDVNDIVKLGLYKDQEISAEDLNSIISESEFGKLFNAALNFLSYRPRSEWEVKTYLVRKVKSQKSKVKSPSKNLKVDNEPELIDNILEKLRKIGQINDEEFAKWFIEQRQTFRPMGKRGIKYELAKKGVPKETVAKLLNSYIVQDEKKLSEHDLAVKAIQKAVNRLRTADYSKENIQKTKAKMQRFLASRGFDWDTIKEVVDELLRKEYNNGSN